jgi:hypothetical protein
MEEGRGREGGREGGGERVRERERERERDRDKYKSYTKAGCSWNGEIHMVHTSTIIDPVFGYIRH